jgi:hypothetical protein
MTATLDEAAADPQQTVVKLQQQIDEALQRETATAEVLGVINSSPGDLAPVFDALLEKAMCLCGAAFGTLTIRNGDRFEPTVVRGVPDAYAEFMRNNPPNPEDARLHELLPLNWEKPDTQAEAA